MKIEEILKKFKHFAFGGILRNIFKSAKKQEQNEIQIFPIAHTEHTQTRSSHHIFLFLHHKKCTGYREQRDEWILSSIAFTGFYTKAFEIFQSFCSCKRTTYSSIETFNGLRDQAKWIEKYSHKIRVTNGNEKEAEIKTDIVLKLC